MGFFFFIDNFLNGTDFDNEDDDFEKLTGAEDPEDDDLEAVEDAFEEEVLEEVINDFGFAGADTFKERRGADDDLEAVLEDVNLVFVGAEDLLATLFLSEMGGFLDAGI